MIVTLIPAAGASSRMRGADKLLERIDGVPALRRAAMEAIRANLGPVVVTLRVNDGERREALRTLDLKVLEVVDAKDGMAASLRAGAAWALPHLLDATDTDSSADHGLLIMLPDMPDIVAEDIQAMDRLHSAHGGAIIRATDATGRPGHPVIFPTYLLRNFEDLRGDRGAASIMLDGSHIVMHDLGGTRATRDLDTPEDWAAWRSEHP